MRKTMTKEVTKTTVKVAKMEVGENGLPQAVKLDDVVLVGNVTLEKAQKEVTKQLGAGVTVFGVEAATELYRMDVADFLKYATKVDPSEATADESAEPDVA